MCRRSNESQWMARSGSYAVSYHERYHLGRAQCERSTDMNPLYVVITAGLLAVPTVWARPPVPTIQWRWRPSSAPHNTKASGAPRSSLFESDKKWGWKEWAIIGGGAAAVAAIAVVATSGSGGGSR